ncbi:MAG: hypothetical protein AB7O68_12135 [Pirellulales bacterium]
MASARFNLLAAVAEGDAVGRAEVGAATRVAGDGGAGAAGAGVLVTASEVPSGLAERAGGGSVGITNTVDGDSSPGITNRATFCRSGRRELVGRDGAGCDWATRFAGAAEIAAGVGAGATAVVGDGAVVARAAVGAGAGDAGRRADAPEAPDAECAVATRAALSAEGVVADGRRAGIREIAELRRAVGLASVAVATPAGFAAVVRGSRVAREVRGAALALGRFAADDALRAGAWLAAELGRGFSALAVAGLVAAGLAAGLAAGSRATIPTSVVRDGASAVGQVTRAEGCAASSGEGPRSRDTTSSARELELDFALAVAAVGLLSPTTRRLSPPRAHSSAVPQAQSRAKADAHRRTSCRGQYDLNSPKPSMFSSRSVSPCWQQRKDGVCAVSRRV